MGMLLGPWNVFFLVHIRESKRWGYSETPQSNLLLIVDEHHSDGYVFIYDESPCHGANVTKFWFQHHNLELLEWSACSPDLRPIEELRGIFIRHAYRHKKPYESKEQVMSGSVSSVQHSSTKPSSASLNHSKSALQRSSKSKGGKESTL